MIKYIILFGLDKRKMKYIDKKTAIRNGFSPSPTYQISHIFFYLREHIELLKDREYRRLYKEILNYMIHYAVAECDYHPWKRRKNRKNLEMYADVYNSYPGNQANKYTKEQVEEFLDYRRQMWH